MFHRTNSSRIKMPQPHSSVEMHREIVRERTREMFSKQSSRSSQRKLSAALFRTTCKTNNFFKPQSQQAHYKDRFLESEVRPESSLRPFTQSSGRINRAKSSLSIIPARSRHFSNQGEKTPQMTRTASFLRGGSSIDKAVINNVLKSKLNQQIRSPGFSYCDHHQNRELIKVMASQIPSGIKDVVGVQEMIRMSHIFTGTQFKNLNNTKQLKLALNSIKTHKTGDEEDTVTLKSIKRW